MVSLFCFKSSLDKFWTNQDVLYNWEVNFAGTGNRRLCSLQRFFNILLKLTEMKIRTLHRGLACVRQLALPCLASDTVSSQSDGHISPMQSNISQTEGRHIFVFF